MEEYFPPPRAGHAVPGVVPQQQPPQGVVPPPHKDERSQKQALKLRKKLESRQGPSSSSLGAPSSGARSDSSSPKSGEWGCALSLFFNVERVMRPALMLRFTLRWIAEDATGR